MTPPETAGVAQPMTIAQVCHGTLGGSSRAACRLANALARRDHRVQLFSRVAPPWRLASDVQACVLHPGPGDLQAPLYWKWTEPDLEHFADLLAHALTQRRFDILHYHYVQPFAGLVQRLAARLGKAMPPAVGTLHGTDLTRCLGQTAASGLGAAGPVATRVLTTVSQHMGTLAGQLGPDLPTPRVLPNFVEDGWPGGPRHTVSPPVMLHVSNFRAVKDVGLLARLFLAIRARTAAELWLVGDGPELPALRRRLERSSAAADVRYLGARVEPEAQFRAATLLLSTSQEESFGLAVLEALASGVPVVATAVGGVPELVQDEVSGLLFQPTDWEKAAARTVALLADPGRLEAFRRAGLARAAPLRESRVVAGYEDLYREAARRPPV
jgi:N-acetyl-alpha-D-glucosaminyl L-malate synthase BshA